MTRVLSALVLLPLVIGTIWFLPSQGTLILDAVSGVLACIEYRDLARALQITISTGICATAVVLVCCAMWFSGHPGDMFTTIDGQIRRQMAPNAVAFVLLAAAIVTGLVSVASGRPYPGVLADAAATMFAPIYIGLPLGALAAIRAEWTGGGPLPLLLLLGVIVVSDSAQYYTGRAFGKRPLSPAISPKKTVEGAIGGMVFGTAAFVAGGLYLFTAPMWMLVLLGAAMALLGIIGDLFESLLKRSAGVKDSSQLIPGHGGVLDRIDSWLFAAPVYYMFLPVLTR
jgi:phosphatidate cytidylyltransferase